MYDIKPIGVIKRGDTLRIEIEKEFAPALLALDHFSHVIVLWWAHGLDTPEYRGMMQIDPPYAPEHRCGVFATRAPYRPNPIALTVCPVVSVDVERGELVVADIDAVDGTPVLDLKAYFPVCDRVKDAHIPEWLNDWPEWAPENGLSLEIYGEEE